MRIGAFGPSKCAMGRPRSESSESYRKAAIFFSIGGAIFIIVAAVGREVGAFLPIGIALAILSAGFWQRSKKLAKGEEEDSSRLDHP